MVLGFGDVSEVTDGLGKLLLSSEVPYSRFFPQIQNKYLLAVFAFSVSLSEATDLPKNGPVEKICWAPNSRCAEPVPATHFLLFPSIFSFPYQLSTRCNLSLRLSTLCCVIPTLSLHFANRVFKPLAHFPNCKTGLYRRSINPTYGILIFFILFFQSFSLPPVSPTSCLVKTAGLQQGACTALLPPSSRWSTRRAASLGCVSGQPATA